MGGRDDASDGRIPWEPPPPTGQALHDALARLSRGLVPAARAEIAFNARPGAGVRDVLVLDKAARRALGVRFSQLGRDKDLGVSLSGWSDRPTPEAALRALVAHGFASPAEGLRALLQLARVRECAWARRAVFEEDGWAYDPPEAADGAERTAMFLRRRAEIDAGEDLDFEAAERRLADPARR